jgi:dTDP-4-amino-4,6-dideoxygalactose transaminase
VIRVSKPSIPDKKLFKKYLNQMYKNRILTNEGPLIKKFINTLKKKYKLNNIVLVNSATNALMICFKVFNVKKNVLTTPFTYKATANAAKFLNLNVLFSDIDPETLNLDPNIIDKNKYKNVEAIVPVHAFGIPAAIQKFNKFKKIKIIYDAAHCFGLRFKGKSILNYGDASVVSFHATKVFNTCEGAMIVFKRHKDANRAKSLVNIGLGRNNIFGINCKLTELQSAWGLALLKKHDLEIKKRKKIFLEYKNNLKKNIRIPTKDLKENNFSYLPIIMDSEKKIKKVIIKMKKKNIETRRYFYKSLNLISNYKSKKSNPIAEDLSRRILCLPIGSDIKISDIKKIIEVVNSVS